MNLLFDFTVDKATATIYITREFAADLDLVWDAFTKAEMLDQWMGFGLYRHETKEMDFREGGRWLHTMISTEKATRWSLAEFIGSNPSRVSPQGIPFARRTEIPSMGSLPRP